MAASCVSEVPEERSPFIRYRRNFRINVDIWKKYASNNSYFATDINSIFDDEGYIDDAINNPDCPKRFMVLLCRLFCLKGYTQAAKKKSMLIDFMIKNQHKIFPIHDPMESVSGKKIKVIVLNE